MVRNQFNDSHMGEVDPLLDRSASQKRSPIGGGFRGFASLSLMPWAVFLVTVLTFQYAYHEVKVLVWIMTAIFGILILVGMYGGHVNGNDFLKAISFFCLLSLLAAVSVGLVIDGTYLTYYYRLTDGAVYSHVNPDGHTHTSDAGVIQFIDGSFVDDLRTIGFVVGGNIYCVAPVANQAAYASEINYWATGVNCCEKRSNFHCGASHKIGAKSSVVADVEGPDLEHYASAIEEANSFYGLTVPTEQEMQLLRFVSNTKQAVNAEWASVSWSVMWIICLYLLVSMVAAFLLIEFYPKMMSMTFAPRSIGRSQGKGAGYPSYEMTK